MAINTPTSSGGANLRTTCKTPTFLAAKRIAFTSPYGGCPTSRAYEACGGVSIWKQKIKGETHFRELLRTRDDWPELVIMNNFIVERAGIAAVCREVGIDVVHTEDGFLPHYGHVHLDPLGFCWESSLPRMPFVRCTDRHRTAARLARERLVPPVNDDLPDGVTPPFVVWPLQLSQDKVNEHGHRFTDWGIPIRHFRNCLPAEIQLVIKPHPRGPVDGICICGMNNVKLLPPSIRLSSLLSRCAAVAGVNSTVLQEARLLFHKPVYTYGPSWYTSHTELFMPVDYRSSPRRLSRIDDLFNDRLLSSEYLRDYADWYTFQLLARQYPEPLERIPSDPKRFLDWAHRLTFRSFQLHGEQIFEDSYLDR
jgi:hypothetical protein